MNNKNEVFEYLIDPLRQQVNNNRCEDLAHEVQALKNRLRDASKQIKELQEDNIRKSERISHMTGQSSAYRNDALRFQAQVDDLVKRLATATGDVEAYKLIRKGGYISGGQRYVVGEHGPEQSGRRKEDAQGCEHDWYFYNKGASMMCKKCGWGLKK